MSDRTATEWIAVDWGTTNVRAWAIGHDGTVLATATSDQGMGKLSSNEFEPVLLGLITQYISEPQVTPVLCAGMVGAREGWQEAEYITTPCAPPNGSSATRVSVTDPRISVRILPGIKQMSPPDVMRGEETQIAGILTNDSDFDGIICLPGTHTKWVHISAGEIVSFQTAMTGEIFALLQNQSVLRHNASGQDHDQSSFLSAVSDAIARPQSFTTHLFGIRAQDLVADSTPGQSRGRLSGLLIGLELASTRPYWLGQNVAILGAGSLANLYKTALAEQGVVASTLDVTDLTLIGLKSAYQALKANVK